MKKLDMFITKNIPTILSIIGGIGLVSTTALAIKATPKAIDLINSKKVKMAENKKALNKLDIIKIAWRPYIPTGISMLLTLSCIFGSNYLNRRTQLSLISAYGILEKSYKDYISKSEDLLDDNSKNIIKQEVTKSNYIPYKFQNEDKKLFFDYQTMRYFESTFNDVLKAEELLNQELAASGYVTINEFYDFIGIDTEPYFNNFGWCDNGSYNEIVFEHQRVIMDDGLECWLIISNEGLVDCLI